MLAIFYGLRFGDRSCASRLDTPPCGSTEARKNLDRAAPRLPARDRLSLKIRNRGSCLTRIREKKKRAGLHFMAAVAQMSGAPGSLGLAGPPVTAPEGWPCRDGTGQETDLKRSFATRFAGRRLNLHSGLPRRGQASVLAAAAITGLGLDAGPNLRRFRLPRKRGEDAPEDFCRIFVSQPTDRLRSRSPVVPPHSSDGCKQRRNCGFTGENSRNESCSSR